MKLSSFIILFVFLIAGCAVNKKSNDNKKPKIKNVASIYNPSVSLINPQYKVYNVSDTESILYIGLNKNELLIKSDGISNQARILVKYKILIDNDKLNLVDSLTTIYNINLNSQKSNILIDIPLKLQTNNYFILLTIKDLYGNKKVERYFTSSKKSKFSKDNFNVYSYPTNEIKFDNIVHSNDSLKLNYKRESVDKYFVYYFNNTFKQSPPPFTLSFVKAQNLIPDSIFVVENNDSTIFNFKKIGIYKILVDTSQEQGITFFNFGDDFPFIKKPSQMLAPLVYLTSQTEFKKYNQMENKKFAVDKFWLKSSNNVNSAKGLIRVFYNRVKFANIYFTSYKEGWKTDRGMIYIIYGIPSIIYKSSKVEKWIYSKQNSLMQFTFENKNNLYTNNDFEVNHNEAYNLMWYKAIDTWRNGRIFTISQ